MVFAVLVATVLALGAGLFAYAGVPSPPRVTGITDETPVLGPIFHPGVILSLGTNASATLLGGIGVYLRPAEFTLPVLAQIAGSSSGAEATNLTTPVNEFFWEGGVYAVGWNGTFWLLGGQATWGGGYFGSLVAIHGTHLSNLTSLIFPYFAGGGVFALGWNGTSWLLGGNSSAGLSLVAVNGLTVTDLSNSLVGHNRSGWVQLIQWNGREWLLGGQGLFGILSGPRFWDLLPHTPFLGSGVYAGSWNGSVWLAGGGAGRLVSVDGQSVRELPTLSSGFDQAVLMLIPLGAGWLVGGSGTNPDGSMTPELLFWSGTTAEPAMSWGDRLPSSFAGGEIQGGALAPQFGSGSVVVVGEGSYDLQTGYGTGAVALVSTAGG